MQQPGTTKRKRREGWTDDKIAREKQRQKARKQRLKQEGKAPPRKKKTPEQKALKKERKKARKAAEKEAVPGGSVPADYSLPKKALKRWGKPVPLETTYAMEGASAAKGAYVGKNRPVDAESGKDSYTLEGEIAKGRRLIEWDGRYVRF